MAILASWRVPKVDVSVSTREKSHRKINLEKMLAGNDSRFVFDQQVGPYHVKM